MTPDKPFKAGAPRGTLSGIACLLLLTLGTSSASPTPRDSAVESPPSVVGSAHPSQEVPQLEDGWRTGTPEDVGLSSQPLAAMTEALRRDEYPNVHAVLLAKDGRLIYEEHFEGTAWRWMDGRADSVLAQFDRETLHEVRSVTKSVTSAVFGIALESGAIGSVDELLFDYFPEYAHLATPEKQEITLRHVLTMSAGFEWAEVGEDWDDEQLLYASPTPAEVVLSKPLATEPGARYVYNGGLTTLLALVISRATGESFGEYARTRFFEPLGISRVEWGWPGTAKEPRPAEDGSIYVSSCCRTAWRDVEELGWEGHAPWSSVAVPTAGLWIRPRDLLKIGSVYLNGGRWNQRQIVPETWVTESLAHHIDQTEGLEQHGQGVTSHSGYGYQWWHQRYSLPYGEISVQAAFGYGGQRIWIVPELDLVVVHVTGNYNRWYAGYQAERLLLERIMPWALGIESSYRHEMARPVRDLAPGEWSSIALTAEEHARYVGTYDLGGVQLEIYEEDGALRHALPGQGMVTLLPTGDQVFAAGLVEDGEPSKLYWPDERIHFVVDDLGAVQRYEWRDVATGQTTSTGLRARE